jgi:transcriptional regulator GlxA family with amidase domain
VDAGLSLAEGPADARDPYGDRQVEGEARFGLPAAVDEARGVEMFLTGSSRHEAKRTLFPQGGRMDLRVQKIQEMMRDNLHRELSLGKFARSVNLSVWRFCDIFRSEVGMSPIQYLRFLRMERAKQLLESSFLSIKEIGYLVGLNDDSHFVRDFKKAYGLSPKCYRTLFNSGQSNESDDRDDSENETRKGLAETSTHILSSLNIVYVFSCLL